MRITVLAGGVGGARFLRGLRHHLRQVMPDGAGGTTAEITAVVNTGDDMWLTGLRVCPDLDSVMYALAGVNDESRGWGRAGETERVSAELTAYGVGWPWFTLGDLDLGTHITRSHLLRAGLPLSQVTRQLASRWDLGVELLPMSDEEVETHVALDGSTADAPQEIVHFEEWWVRHRAQRPAREFIQAGLAGAAPAPGVLAAIAGADAVILAPSNPVVSIGTIMNVPGIREALRATPAPVVGISPIISGAAVRGMADACLAAIGVRTSADAVALHYGARPAGGILDTWLIDSTDAGLSDLIARSGVRPVVVPLWMNDIQTSADLAAAALGAASALATAAS
ncbi:LPPG:FO 2-phospho-L-lactate transferase [Arthrobacter ginsengisoli]|uniref:LPPG:FO 2-phospho-L-lactate transferase n=1 Tax=Arthrobacter ginsengisoli TaxID=1356565 RepID=A0ABU1UIG0_9MICC|nr:2-phospho-L-lactate transferase [Arthrobacter ginsengisoli]MDR7084920.1 LPPG:FO 2-phospho-L-lactate transferase [Arthrobacter ginsengisoli]